MPITAHSEKGVIKQTMHEFGKGNLHSGGSGKVVKDPKQALAIAYSMSRNRGTEHDPAKKTDHADADHHMRHAMMHMTQSDMHKAHAQAFGVQKKIHEQQAKDHKMLSKHHENTAKAMKRSMGISE